MFQPVFRYFKAIANTSKSTAWKSKGLSVEVIKPPSTSDNSLNPGINYFDNAECEYNLMEIVSNKKDSICI